MLVAQADLLHEGDQVVQEVLFHICPLSHLATVQKSTSKDLPVGGICLPSGPCIGPVMVPVKWAIEQV